MWALGIKLRLSGLGDPKFFYPLSHLPGLEPGPSMLFWRPVWLQGSSSWAEILDLDVPRAGSIYNAIAGAAWASVWSGPGESLPIQESYSCLRMIGIGPSMKWMEGI